MRLSEWVRVDKSAWAGMWGGREGGRGRWKGRRQPPCPSLFLRAGRWRGVKGDGGREGGREREREREGERGKEGGREGEREREGGVTHRHPSCRRRRPSAAGGQAAARQRRRGDGRRTGLSLAERGEGCREG